MSWLEALKMAGDLGLFAGGLGLLKWGWAVERRLMRAEIKLGIEP